MYRRVLFPTDGSEITTKALATALSMAKLTGAALEVLSVTEPYPYSALSEVQPVSPNDFSEAQQRIAGARVKTALDAAQAAGVKARGHTVEAFHPWEAIVAQATSLECDLIVMASHGRRGVSALLLGSETQKVLTHGKLPVLVVR
jgi:nucleotide-binding universal stress UspA family protein